MKYKSRVIIFISILLILNVCISCKKKRIEPGTIEAKEVSTFETNSNEYGPLISITPDEFLKLPEDYQVIYVAGYIDAVTFISYGYSFPDHDEFVECFRSRSIGEFTEEVVKWLKNHPDFDESVASTIARTTGFLCKATKRN